VHEVGRSSGRFVFDYEAFTIPDQFQVIYEGNTLFDTHGPVSGNASVTIPFSGTSSEVTVKVTGNTDPNTQWSYTVHCATP
jgi:hypothetical protein